MATPADVGFVEMRLAKTYGRLDHSGRPFCDRQNRRQDQAVAHTGRLSASPRPSVGRSAAWLSAGYKGTHLCPECHIPRLWCLT
jgi:hypothetical protein